MLSCMSLIYHLYIYIYIIDIISKNAAMGQRWTASSPLRKLSNEFYMLSRGEIAPAGVTSKRVTLSWLFLGWTLKKNSTVNRCEKDWAGKFIQLLPCYKQF
jgi:hypothetical protein